MNDFVQSTLKACAAGLAAAAAYLVGVLGGDATFADITLTQWLGIIPVVAGVYGITWTVPNTPAISNATAGDVLDIVEAYGVEDEPGV